MIMLYEITLWLLREVPARPCGSSGWRGPRAGTKERNVIITNVVWVQDRVGHRALDLRLDGHPAHFDSSQRSVLLERGILTGVAAP